MKKTIIFLSMLMVFSHSLWAQLHSYIEDASGSFGPTAGSSVVRNYNDDYAIGFFKEKDSSYFYAVKTASGMDSITQRNKILVNVNWDVKDIYFHNGEAFFCGSVVGNGIVGHFPVSNLINGSGVVPVVSRVIPGKPLRRLVAYTDASSYRVVAIDSTVIVSCDFTSPTYDYRDFPLSDGELVYDVLLKDNSLLFVGTDTTYNCITVRRSNCANPIYQTHLWRYHPAPYPTRVIPTGSIATLLPGDQLAVVHQVVNNELNIEMDLIVIQLSNMQCINRQAFINLHRVHYHDLKYIPAAHRLALLYTDFVLFDTYVLEWQLSQNTTYSANVLQPTLRYSSMDRIGNLHFFMVSGFHWMLQNTQGWVNACDMHWMTPIFKKQNHDLEHPAIVPMKYWLPLSSPLLSNITVTSFNVAIDCFH